MSMTYLVPSLFFPVSSISQAIDMSLASIKLISGQILCSAQKATQSSVALMPPINEPWIDNLLNMMPNWGYSIGLGMPPTHDRTPFFLRQVRVAMMSWWTATVSMIKSQLYLNSLSDSGSPVIQTSCAPFFLQMSSLSLERVNATTSCPIAAASLIPMVPSPPIPTIPIFIFAPFMQLLSTKGDHIVIPAHRIGAMFASGMPSAILIA